MRCTNYKLVNSRPERCPRPAIARLYAPGPALVPGSILCLECAKEITNEYRELLGQVWTMVPVDEYGDEIKTLLTEKP